MIFRDPARTVVLSYSKPLPSPLPSDQLHGLLNKGPDTRGRLMIALVTIHALQTGDLRRLLIDDLDRSTGRLSVRRAGHADHIVYLDETTLGLATAWIAERTRRWPRTTNPYLFVTRVSAASDRNPTISKQAFVATFRENGLQPSKLREDRILDEAKETADPVHLMRVFGLSDATAVRYVAAAHPADIRPDPIAP